MGSKFKEKLLSTYRQTGSVVGEQVDLVLDAVGHEGDSAIGLY